MTDETKVLARKADDIIQAAIKVFNEIGVGLSDSQDNKDQFGEYMITLLLYKRGLRDAVDMMTRHPTVLKLEADYGIDIDKEYAKKGPHMAFQEASQETLNKYRKKDEMAH